MVLRPGRCGDVPRPAARETERSPPRFGRVSSLSIQALIVGSCGLLLAVAIVALTRRGTLSLQYGIGWLAVAAALLVSAALLGLIRPVADALGMSPTGLIVGGVGSFLLLVALQLSIAISGLQEAVRDLSESLALLELRVQRAERVSGVDRVV